MCSGAFRGASKAPQSPLHRGSTFPSSSDAVCVSCSRVLRGSHLVGTRQGHGDITYAGDDTWKLGQLISLPAVVRGRYEESLRSAGRADLVLDQDAAT